MTPDQLADRLRGFARALEQGAGGIALVAAIRAMAVYKRRIFNDGLTSSGVAIGRYSQEWSEVRRARGRQVSYVDLQFTGELFESIQVGTRDNRVVIETKNRLNFEKVENIEQKFKKDIFSFGANERDAYTKGIELELINLRRQWLI